MDMVCKAAERLGRAVEEPKFVVGHAQLEGRVTISLGVACHGGLGATTTPRNSLKAGNALYRAKRNGMNGVDCSRNACS
jgi:GGDEF domain-containing protein